MGHEEQYNRTQRAADGTDYRVRILPDWEDGSEFGWAAPLGMFAWVLERKAVRYEVNRNANRDIEGSHQVEEWHGIEGAGDYPSAEEAGTDAHAALSEQLHAVEVSEQEMGFERRVQREGR